MPEEKLKSERHICQFCKGLTYVQCPECRAACCLACGANICPICVRIQLFQTDYALANRIVSWQYVELTMLPWPRALHFVSISPTPAQLVHNQQRF